MDLEFGSEVVIDSTETTYTGNQNDHCGTLVSPSWENKPIRNQAAMNISTYFLMFHPAIPVQTEVPQNTLDQIIRHRLDYIESKIREKTNQYGYVTLDECLMTELASVLNHYLTNLV